MWTVALLVSSVLPARIAENTSIAIESTLGNDAKKSADKVALE
jgi:hypothetical protein